MNSILAGLGLAGLAALAATPDSKIKKQISDSARFMKNDHEARLRWLRQEGMQEEPQSLETFIQNAVTGGVSLGAKLYEVYGPRFQRTKESRIKYRLAMADYMNKILPFIDEFPVRQA